MRIISIFLLFSLFVFADEKAKVFQSDDEVTFLEHWMDLKAGLGPVYTAIFYNQKVISAGQDGTIRSWDVTTVKEEKILRGHTATIRALALHSDMLASASLDGVIKLWDLKEDKQIATFADANEGGVNSISFNEDGNLLAAGYRSGVIKVYDVKDQRCINSIENRISAVNTVLFDQTKIVAAYHNGSIQIFDKDSSISVKAHHGIFTCGVAGSLIAWSGECKEIHIADKVVGNHESTVYALAFNQGGSQLVSCDQNGVIKVWDVKAQKEIESWQAHDARINQVSFSQDGKLIVSASDDGAVKVWGSQNQGLICELKGHLGELYSLTISLDGRLLAATGEDGWLRIWDAQGMQPVRTLRTGAEESRTARFSPDSKMLAVAVDEDVKLYDSTTFNEITTFKKHIEVVYALEFNSDGSILASAAHDGKIMLWDLKEKKLLKELWGHSGGVYSLAFRPGHSELLSGGHMGYIRTFDMKSLEEVDRVRLHRGNIRSICFKRDGAIFATGSVGETKVWQSSDMKELLHFLGHERKKYVSSVLFNRAGDLLISGCWDDTIKIWDVNLKSLIQDIKVEGKWIWEIAFDPDEKLLLAACGNGYIKIYKWHEKFYIKDVLIDWSAVNLLARAYATADLKTNVNDKSLDISIKVTNNSNWSLYRLKGYVQISDSAGKSVIVKPVYFGHIPGTQSLTRKLGIAIPDNARGQMKVLVSFVEHNDNAPDTVSADVLLP